MATTSKRILWKGAISFGLVHIPIALHSATQEHSLNFDWLDKRTMDPVGYKRVNKKTGKEISRENIVKGIEIEDGHYVVLTPEEIGAAYPKTTQTIEIESFVDADSIPFMYMERPYYVSPINKGQKVYALLREVLTRSGKIGIAKVVIQTKQHLAVLIPFGSALVLNLLRWGDEVRTADALDLPAKGAKAAGLSDKELKMAQQLVDDMSDEWNPDAFTDSFKEQILALVEQKVKSGDTEAVTQIAQEEPGETARIYDLTEMLQRSLQGKGKSTEEKPKRSAPAKAVSIKTAKKRAAPPARKTASRKTSTTSRPAAKKTAAKSSKPSAKTASKRKSA